MKAGTVVKYGNANLGIFLYPHEEISKEDTLCSVLSTKNKKITHVPYNDMEVYNIGSLNDENFIKIYDLEKWHDIKGVKSPDGEDNFWVALDNSRLVYKGEILDIEFEMCVEEFFELGINPVLVMDLECGEVFIYTDKTFVDEANKIINKICEEIEDVEDYINIDFSEI